MNKNRQVVKYLLCDYFSAFIAWVGLFMYRKIGIEHSSFDDVNAVFQDSNLWRGMILLPILWVVFYAMQGTYKDVFRKSRLKELQNTLIASVTGIIIIFFVLLLDDNIASYKNYYSSFIVLFLLHFSLTYLCRLVITSRTVHRVHARKIGFNTLLIGSKDTAYKIFQEIDSQETYSGNLFVGFVTVNGSVNENLQKIMPHLG
jgi:FlaA1/EpsC-like NDP-sugar epimerase